MNAKRFGAYVRGQRYLKGISIADASKQTGISEVQLRNIEKGLCAPQPATFIKIINGLHLDSKEAITASEDEQTDTVDETKL